MSRIAARTARALTAVTLGVALAASAFVVAPAWADDTQAQADQAATAIAAAAGGTVVAPATTGEAATATLGDTQVTLPATSDGAVTVATTDPSLGSLVTPVTISLPKETGGKHAKQAKDGTMVYPGGSGNSADAAVQVLSDGSVRLSTVLASKHSPTRFTYTIAGATPELQADGSVNLVQTTDMGGALIQATVGTIAPAWAKDANGRPVATHYEVKGNGQLVQVVSPDKNTAYPVVADPAYTLHWDWFWGWEIQFNKAVTLAMSGSSGVASGWLAYVATAVTTLAKANALAAAIAGTAAIVAATAVSFGYCVMIVGVGQWAVPGVWLYRGGNCQ